MHCVVRACLMMERGIGLWLVEGGGASQSVAKGRKCKTPQAEKSHCLIRKLMGHEDLKFTFPLLDGDLLLPVGN
jgi:hypothetical protein